MNRQIRFFTVNVLIGAIVTLAIAGAIIAVSRLQTRDKETSGLSDAFTYDLKNLRKTDPKLIQYEEGAPIQTGFRDVFGIALGPNDAIYVAGDGSVRAFNGNGSRLSEVRLTDSPRCLAVADDGTLYIGMKEHIEVYDPKGVRKANWESLGKNALLTSIAVSGHDVFAADAGNRAVLHYTTSGKLVNLIGKKDETRDIPGFVVPSPYFDLALAPDGLLRVANPGRHRVEAYTFNGDLEFWWGKVSMGIEGFAGCGNPVNFALLSDGTFVTCEKGLPRVKIYAADGDFVGVVAGAELFPTYTYDGFSSEQTGELDVAVDSQGRILVLDAVEKTVRIFTRIKAG